MITSFSGALRNIKQIGIEFHDVQTKIAAYFRAVRSLYREGFVAVAWDPNITTHPIGFYDYFEIVFRRSDMAQCRTK